MTVRCPDCGGDNRSQSKYCSTCGHQLRPQTAGRCPHCSAQNPPNNIFCDECGQRLVPISPELDAITGESPVRGLSLPRKELPEEEQVPDWLAQLRGDLPDGEGSPPGQPETPPLDQDTSSPADTIPDPTEPAPEPDAPRPDPIESRSDPVDEDEPDWLKEVIESSEPTQADLESAESSALSAMQPGDLPDWLQDALEDVNIPSAPEPIASDLPVDESGLEPGEIPEWLSGLAPEAAPSTKPQEEESPVDEPPDLPETPPVSEAVPEATLPPLSGGELDLTELPDWLQDLKPVDTTQEEPTSPPGEDQTGEPGEMPDWLQAASVEEVAAEAQTAPAEEDKEADEVPESLPAEPSDETTPVDEPEEIEAPAWLQDVAMGSQDEPEAPATLSGAARGDPDALPDWLQEFTEDDATPDTAKLAQPEPLIPRRKPPPKPTPKPPGTGPLEAKELKDWLGETAAAPEGQAPTDEAAPEARGTGPLAPPELPDWLVTASDTPDTGELPDWLIEMSEDVAPAAVGPALPRDGGESAPLPSWVFDEDPSPIAPEVETAESAPPELPDWMQPIEDTGAESALAAAELPDWLVPPEGVTAEAAPPIEEVAPDLPAWPQDDELPEPDEAVAPGLAQAVIPDWLQALKPKVAVAALEPETVREPETIETGGPLAGVRGALMIEGAVVSPPTSRALPKFVVTEQQQAHAQVLKQVLHTGPAPKPESPSARPPQWWLERGLIPVLVFLAVLIPALFGGQPFSFEGQPIPQEINDTYELLNGLPELAPVVVAFDYSPSWAGELGPVSTPLLRHLMERRARIVAVSTVPTGPELAQATLEELAADYDYSYGTDYLNLGYIPGGAMGLRAFASAPWEMFSQGDYVTRESTAQDSPVATGLADSLQDAGLVLILTARQDDLVGWVEQVGQLPGMGDVPMAAGVSAGLEPWARPYYLTDPKQLSGLVSGVPGAAQYERRAGQEPPYGAAVLLDSQMVALIVIIIFIVIGLLWGTVAGMTRRRQGDG